MLTILFINPINFFQLSSLKDIPYLIVVLAIAFSIHEFSHAFVAYKFGDATAKDQGRLTLFPHAHLDILGTIMILIAGFGWAKPVPVNRFNFKKPRLAGVLVSIAGPLSNLLLVIIGYSIWLVLNHTGYTMQVSDRVYGILYKFFNLFITMNAILFLFNLLPFPPLDGYRIIEDLSTPSFRAKLTQYESYGIFIFLILVITPLGYYIFHPLFATAVPWVVNMVGTMMMSLFS